MDSLSALDPLAWQPEYLREHPAYAAGNAFGWLQRVGGKQAATSYPLAGRLYLAKSGWLLLSVPNALVRGVFDALTEPGTELPTAGVMNVPNVDGELLNAHISVMTADEVNQVGADKINERGHMFGYTLGGLKEIDVKSVDGVSKVWVLQVSSPGLSALRKSYGLSALPKDDQPFHITFAVRRKGILLDNGKAKGYETAAESADGQRFSNPISRGELKAASAAADETTYDCNCSGACTCPPTCVCKQSGYCDATHKTAASDMPARDNTPASVDNLSRSGKKDLLPGGKADNLPDREISADSLAEGAKHEHEHTRNDQVAKEIAKDHLSEDPQYYEKVKEIEKGAEQDDKPARPRILDELRAAKTHSDRRDYERKHEILRRLIAQSPQDWHVDDPKPKYKGITHLPTKFRFHAPAGVVGAHVKAATNSVYAQQFGNLLNFRTPFVFDHGKPVYENVVDHLLKAKQRGDFILASRMKAHQYRSMLDPRYRYEMAQAAATGTLPQMNTFDKATQLYGNDVFDTIKNWGKPNGNAAAR
jgi:hypothetical protein